MLSVGSMLKGMENFGGVWGAGEGVCTASSETGHQVNLSKSNFVLAEE